MSKKNTRNALDTSLSYAVIGLDLANLQVVKRSLKAQKRSRHFS